MLKLKNFINGEYIEPSSKMYLANYEPATGEIYSQLPDSNIEDVNLAVIAAKKAFIEWSRTTVQERSDVLYKIADILESRLEEFILAESKDQGKNLKTSKNLDIPRTIHNFRFFAGAILHDENKSTNFNNIVLNYTTKKPIGIVGLISPWNLPLYLLSWKIAPALACGNVVICKPSEFTSMTAYLLGAVLNEAGLPKGVCNLLFGLGSKVGESIVTHPEIKAISFTGGTKTGEKVIVASAPYFKKLSLELGGKNPNIIFEDANFSECIATTVRSSFLNQGEICLCGSRIFVQDTIYYEFLEAFVRETKKLKVGNPYLEETDIGALVSKEHLEKVTYYVNLAKEEGGSVILGGKKAIVAEPFTNGYFFEPTIITGLNNSCRTLQEEIFGPVVTITPFKTEDEVIEYANTNNYGLSASIWTESLKRAHSVADKIEAGTVWVNTWLMRDLRVPFGGIKHSGLGREGGEYSLDFYTETKNICIKYS